MPQDVKTSPDGKVIYVADMMADGVHVIDAEKFVELPFIPTGARGAWFVREPGRQGAVLFES